MQQAAEGQRGNPGVGAVRADTPAPDQVEGYVSLYDPDSATWTIVYDPNTNNETMVRAY